MAPPRRVWPVRRETGRFGDAAHPSPPTSHHWAWEPGAATEASLRLRALHAAYNGLDTAHTLPVMVSPPTVTDTASTSPPSGMTVIYTCVSGSLVPAKTADRRLRVLRRID